MSNTEIDTFLIAFGGQLVTITTSLVINSSFEDKLESLPVLFEGILLDHDNDYIYLGESINEITSAIKKSSIVHIHVKEESNVLDEIFNSMPDPKNEEIN